MTRRTVKLSWSFPPEGITSLLNVGLLDEVEQDLVTVSLDPQLHLLIHKGSIGMVMTVVMVSLLDQSVILQEPNTSVLLSYHYQIPA